ncbi:MAG: hypothetical protein KAT71_04770 [Gammaproteobacteria bacterium]|nr:hypothetical protein [Gammaproteobacteria bacterium]
MKKLGLIFAAAAALVLMAGCSSSNQPLVSAAQPAATHAQPAVHGKLGNMPATNDYNK